MSALTLRLPDSLHRSIKALARDEGISVNQFIASAVGEKMSAILTVEHLRHEAAQGRRADFMRFLSAVPSRAVAETDRLPEKKRRK